MMIILNTNIYILIKWLGFSNMLLLKCFYWVLHPGPAVFQLTVASDRWLLTRQKPAAKTAGVWQPSSTWMETRRGMLSSSSTWVKTIQPYIPVKISLYMYCRVCPPALGSQFIFICRVTVTSSVTRPFSNILGCGFSIAKSQGSMP